MKRRRIITVAECEWIDKVMLSVRLCAGNQRTSLRVTTAAILLLARARTWLLPKQLPQSSTAWWVIAWAHLTTQINLCQRRGSSSVQASVLHGKDNHSGMSQHLSLPSHCSMIQTSWWYNLYAFNHLNVFLSLIEKTKEKHNNCNNVLLLVNCGMLKTVELQLSRYP